MSDLKVYASLPPGHIWKVLGKHIVVVPKYKTGALRRFFSWVEGRQSLSTVYQQMVKELGVARLESFEDIRLLQLLKSNVVLRWRDYRTKSGWFFRWLDGRLHYGSVRKNKDRVLQIIYEQLRLLFFGQDPLVIPILALNPPPRTGEEAERRFLDAVYQILTAPAMSLAHYQTTEAVLQGLLFERGGQSLYMWYRRFALLGFPGAQYRLGCFYDEGSQGLSHDMSKALKHYQAAAKGGIAEAQYISAEFLRTKDHPSVEERTQAVEWFEQAARCGHDWATLQLGVCYEEGWGTGKDARLAIFYLKGLLGPERSNDLHAVAAYYLGRIYETQEQLEEAAQFYLEAVDLAHDQALSELALLGRSEIREGVDHAPAIPDEPPPSGSLLPHDTDLFDVAWMLKHGILLKKDVEKAQQLFTRAAHLESDSPADGHLHAQYECGRYFLNKGEMGQARKAFTYAAEQEHALAIEQLTKIDKELYPPAI